MEQVTYELQHGKVTIHGVDRWPPERMAETLSRHLHRLDCLSQIPANSDDLEKKKDPAAA